MDIPQNDKITFEDLKRLLGDFMDASYMKNLQKQKEEITRARDMFADVKNSITVDMFTDENETEV